MLCLIMGYEAVTALMTYTFDNVLLWQGVRGSGTGSLLDAFNVPSQSSGTCCCNPCLPVG